MKFKALAVAITVASLTTLATVTPSTSYAQSGRRICGASAEQGGVRIYSNYQKVSKGDWFVCNFVVANAAVRAKLRSSSTRNHYLQTCQSFSTYVYGGGNTCYGLREYSTYETGR